MPNGGRRRKSAYVGFSVISLSAATLAGCDEPVRDPEAQDTRVYTSVADCEREAPARACEDGWTAAQGEHGASAPLFSDRAGCETQWGQGRCTQGAGPRAAQYFVPAVAGFMLVSSFRRPQCDPGTGVACDQAGGGHGGGWVTASHPVYIGSGGKVFAGWQPVGDAVRTANGGLSVPRTVTVVAEGGRVSPGITTRGGFGRAFGRFGGGRGG
jgi:uncharacterized protein YgiB involved in biofilm formation